MIDQKVKTVMLCVLCDSLNHECDHEAKFHYRAYQDQLCLTVYSLNSEAQSCCGDLISKEVVPEHCYAPVSKRVAKPSEYYPTEAVKRAKGR